MFGRGKRILAAYAVLGMLLFPGLADARLGGGSSMGSRGGMTFSPPPVTNTAPNVASPFGRTMTSPTPSPSYGSPGYAPRSSFTSGLMGGLIGAGIGGLLFGGGFFGHGLGFGGFLGFLIQMFLIVMIGRFLWRRFMGGQSVFAGGPGLYARGGAPGGVIGGMMGAGPSPVRQPGGSPVAITQADFQEFEQLLQAAQAAWSA